MPTLIYVETTIPSFYTETREDEEVRIRRKWTREWWDAPKPDTRLVTSTVVIEELEAIPDAARREEALGLVRFLEQLEHTPEIGEVVSVYLRHRLMPADLLGDADHLALA